MHLTQAFVSQLSTDKDIAELLGTLTRIITTAERHGELFNSPETKKVMQEIGSITLDITSLLEKYAHTSLAGE